MRPHYRSPLAPLGGAGESLTTSHQDTAAEEVSGVGAAARTWLQPCASVSLVCRLAAGSALTQTGFASLAFALNEPLLSRLLFLGSG